MRCGIDDLKTTQVTRFSLVKEYSVFKTSSETNSACSNASMLARCC